MKRYLIPLALLVFTALVIAPLAQTMRTANTTNDLVLLSPYTINTNTYVVTEGTIGDGTATWWTFVAGDVTGPDATHLQPLLYPTAGRWVKNTGGSGGTNIFNTIYATNIYGSYNYFSNVYVTNLFVTNIFNRGGAKPMIKLGDTNIYITNTFITINGTNLAVVNPTDGYVPYRASATNFLDSYFYYNPNGMGTDTNLFFGPGTTNYVARTNGVLQVKSEPFLFSHRDTNIVYVYDRGDIEGGRAPSMTFTNDATGRTVWYGMYNSDGWIEPSSAFLYINGNLIMPGGFDILTDTDNSTDLGSSASNGAFQNIWQKGSHYLESYNNGVATNVVWTRMWMSNRTAIFNMVSLTNNTDGQIDGYSFRTNGVEVFNVTGTGGPSSGANWTAVGATDSSLAGTATMGSAVVTNDLRLMGTLTGTNSQAVDQLLEANGTAVYWTGNPTVTNLTAKGGLTVGNSSTISFTVNGAANYMNSSVPMLVGQSGQYLALQGSYIRLFNGGTECWDVYANDLNPVGNLTRNVGNVGAMVKNVFTGGLVLGIHTTTTNYTSAVSDHTVLLNGTTLTNTLPTAVGATGQEYEVVEVAASTGTVATTSGQTINGAASYALSAQWKYVKVVSDGANWVIVCSN